jgi:short subunit dehydrogenase-like uncharacterized protein
VGSRSGPLRPGVMDVLTCRHVFTLEMPERTMATSWMLYGVNGYTGALLLEEALRQGERPVLAARRKDAVEPLATRHGLEARVFALEDVDTITAQLHGVRAVLHAAGPFGVTSAPMVEACLRAGVHYLDITGEIAVFEACFARDAQARERNVALLPGVGFDVVPSDCLAATLAAALPGAASLEMAFATAGGISRGTTLTAVTQLGADCLVRRGGAIVPVPLGSLARPVAFRDKTRTVMAIPWGDVSTAFHSTAIPNITVFLAVPRRAPGVMKLLSASAPLLSTRPVQALLEGVVKRAVTGPNAQQRAAGWTQMWGQVKHADGRTCTATLVTPEGYALTVLAALESVKRVAAPDFAARGFLTPSRAFGADYITHFAGCSLQAGAVTNG